MMQKYFLLILFYTSTKINALSLTENFNYRLPDDHIPQNYELTLSLNPENSTFFGQLNITFETVRDVKYLLLHASPTTIYNITDVKLDFIHDCEVYKLDKKIEMLNITCGTTFFQGQHKLTMQYYALYGIEGTTNDYVGFYKSSYEIMDGNSAYAVTQFEPTFARSTFPCFDEPKFKAGFEITVLHPSNYNVLSNTDVASRESLSALLVKTTFKKTPPISTYLIAFVISNFKINVENSNSTPSINVHSRPSQVTHTETAKKHTRGLVDALGEWTNISYVDLGISKLDLVAVPDFLFGAMENWGLITFQEVDLLDEAQKTSAEDKQNIISVIAHELTHHWFGDYVTLDWWSNAWLNEGFATYFQYYIPDLVPDLKLELGRQFVPLCLHAAFEADGAEASPLSSRYEDVKTPSEDLNKFNGISYDKGASIIRMMEGVLGEDNFRSGIQFYLENNAYNNTSPQILLESLGEFRDCDGMKFQDLMKNWIYQSGYPIVTASINKTNNIVIIEQAEFPHNGTKSDEQKFWMIPITFATSENVNNSVHWMDNNTLEISIKENSWIILNLEQKGYYRVNYDEELWNRIISVLKSDDMEKIHVLNRAQLLDDAFALAKIGKLRYATAFELASYLTRENEFEPWYVAVKSLNYIKALLEVHADTEALNNLKKLVLKWVNEAFKNDKKWNSHLEILTKEIIYDLKCNMGDSKCLDDSSNVLQKFIKSKEIEDHNTRKTALCYGLKSSSSPENDYNELLTLYTNSDSAIEQRVILKSLGCINDPTVLKKYLDELLLNGTVIARLDAKYVYRAVAANEQIGLEVLFPFLEANLEKIIQKYSGLITLSDLILLPAKWIVSQGQISQLKELLENKKDVDGIDDVGKKAMELPHIYIQWFELNRKEIEIILIKMTSRSNIIVPSFLLMVSLIHLLIFLPNIFE